MGTSLRTTLLLLTFGLWPLAVSNAGDRFYATRFGDRVLRRTDQVVLAQVERVQAAFRGISTARLLVQESLLGFDRDPSLTLLYVDELLAPRAFGSRLERSSVSYERERREGLVNYLKRVRRDAEPPLANRNPRVSRETATADAPDGSGGTAGVRLARDEAGIFFLRRKGASYALVGFVPRSDPLFAQKEKRLRELLAVEKAGSAEQRVDRARKHFLAGLRNPSVWLRANAAGEIAALATRYPRRFTKADKILIERALVAEKETAIGLTLETALRAIDPQAALVFATRAEDRERKRLDGALGAERERIDRLRDPDLRAADIGRAGQRYGRAGTGLVALYLEDEAAVVRMVAAQTLADHGGPSCRTALREALAREKDTKTVHALLHACGMKSDPQAVQLIAQRLKEPATARPALYALARIGSPSALGQIRAHKKVASAENAALIDALLREDFPRRS